MNSDPDPATLVEREFVREPAGHTLRVLIRFLAEGPERAILLDPSNSPLGRGAFSSEWNPS